MDAKQTYQCEKRKCGGLGLEGGGCRQIVVTGCRRFLGLRLVAVGKKLILDVEDS